MSLYLPPPQQNLWWPVLEPSLEELRHCQRHLLCSAGGIRHEVDRVVLPRIFVEKGYAIPTTWNEMWALSDQMVADGVTPWCGGLESGSDTGWPASDWLAQVMLRLFGSDVYDQWVVGDLPFSSPQVGAAMDIVAGWMKNLGTSMAGTVMSAPFRRPGWGGRRGNSDR